MDSVIGFLLNQRFIFWKWSEFGYVLIWNNFFYSSPNRFSLVLVFAAVERQVSQRWHKFFTILCLCWMSTFFLRFDCFFGLALLGESPNRCAAFVEGPAFSITYYLLIYNDIYNDTIFVSFGLEFAAIIFICS